MTTKLYKNTKCDEVTEALRIGRRLHAIRSATGLTGHQFGRLIDPSNQDRALRIEHGLVMPINEEEFFASVQKIIIKTLKDSTLLLRNARKAAHLKYPDLLPKN